MTKSSSIGRATAARLAAFRADPLTTRLPMIVTATLQVASIFEMLIATSALLSGVAARER